MRKTTIEGRNKPAQARRSKSAKILLTRQRMLSRSHQTRRMFQKDLALAQFRAGLASGRMHHAWLLAGPRDIGKASFAPPVPLIPAGSFTTDDQTVKAGVNYRFNWGGPIAARY